MNKLAKLDPVTGPLSREQFARLVEAPFGKAVQVIREYDPEYGRKPGEKFKWKVLCRGDMNGVAYIEAANQKEADELADKLTDGEVDWDCGDGDFIVVSVEPDKK